MEALVDRKAVDEIAVRYQALVALVPLHILRTEVDYEKAVSVLNQLIDAAAVDDGSLLAGLADMLGSLVCDYEDRHHPTTAVSPVAMLQFLMEQHALTQSDLPEVGSQGVVSEILRGKRQLNLRQIKALTERFHVPAALFI